MKKTYDKATIVADIKAMDMRAQKLSDAEVDMIMDEGYSELCGLVQPFTDEEVVEMGPYYTADELKLTLDVEEDVLYIYDLYATDESVTPLHKIYNKDGVYQDSRYTGRVHVDLNLLGTVDNVVVKYAYTPEASDANIYVDKPTYNCMLAAFRVALDVRFKDDKREATGRARLHSKCLNLLPNYPQDMIQSPL